MALVCGVLAIRGPRPNWGPTCVIAAVGVSLTLWLKSIRLKIACGELWYSTLFGTHSIQLAKELRCFPEKILHAFLVCSVRSFTDRGASAFTQMRPFNVSGSLDWFSRYS